MFSSIRLGSRPEPVRPLQLRLCSELITLSGCGTGLNVVVGGDELLDWFVDFFMPAHKQSWYAVGRERREYVYIHEELYEDVQDHHKAAALQQAMRACVNATLTLIMGSFRAGWEIRLWLMVTALLVAFFFHVSQEKYLHIHERLTSGQDSISRVFSGCNSKPNFASVPEIF